MTAVFPNAAITPGVGAPLSPSGTDAATSGRRGDATAPAGGPSFADLLAQRTGAGQAAGQVQFSRHALERVTRRGLNVDPATLQRLGQGVSRAATKGARDAVVFVDNTAFVVSVPNKTVITAVGSEHMREHVFTNIDSAVIA